MNRFFVLFVNDNGFIGDSDHIVNNVTKARFFESRMMADEYRDAYHSKHNDFQSTISILEWL